MHRKFWLVLVAAALGGAWSCSEEHPEVVRSVTLVAPGDGSILTVADDLDATTAGLQLEVLAATTGVSAGARAMLTVDGAVVVEGLELAADGTLHIPRVTLHRGSRTLTLTIFLSDLDGRDTSLAATSQVTVDIPHAAPNLEIVAPLARVLNMAADDAPATPGLQTTVKVSLTGPVVDSKLVLCARWPGATSPECASAPGNELAVLVNPGSGVIEFPVTLPEGQIELSAEVRREGSEVFTSATVLYTVDSAPPVLTFVAPKDGDTVTTYALAMEVGVEGVGAGSELQLTSPSLAAPLLAPVDAGGKAKFELPSLLNGIHSFTAKISDAAGNPGEAQASVTVAAPGCRLGLVHPASGTARFNAADDKDSNPANGLQVDLMLTTDCVSSPAELFVDGSTVAKFLSTPSGAITIGNMSFNDGITDVPVEIRMTDINGQVTSVAFTVSVKLTAPVLELTPARPGSGTLTYVAAGNPRIDGTAVIRDLVDGGNAEAEFGATVLGAAGGRFSMTLAGVDLFAPRPIAGSTENFGGPLALVFPQNTDAALVVTATDAFGNSTSETYRLVVDVQAPAAPTAMTATLVDNRNAKVKLDWTSPGDDGPTGNVAKYEVKLLTSTMDGTGFEQPTLDAAAYAAKAVVLPNTPQGTAGGATVTYSAEKLAPLNFYCFAGQAIDEVGNVSPVSAPVCLKNFWNEIGPFEGSSTGSFYGLLMRTGDFDNDGVADLVVAARAEAPAGKVYIYYGERNGVFGTRRVTLSGQVAGELFGGAIATADLNGDGIADLVVAANSFSGNLGRAFIYFGRQGQLLDSSTSVELRGRAAAGGFGYSLGVVGDVDGDGLNDLLIGARNEGPGHAFLFKGRTETQWRADRTSTDSGFVPYIAAADATRIFIGSVTGERLGARDGFTTLGDLDGDGKAEFAIPASRDSMNRLYLFKGATVTGISGRAIEAADAMSILTRSSPASVGGLEGFGAFAKGNVDIDMDGFPDLLVSHPIANQVLLYRGDSVTRTIVDTPAVTTVAPLHVSTSFGASIDVSDFNGDGRPDLLVGNNSAAPGAAGSSTVWVFYNDGTANPFGHAGSSLRKGVAFSAVVSADFSGNGKAGLAVADISDGNGKVWIYVP